MDKEAGYRAAVAETKAGAGKGGVPIGACLVSRDGKILGKGRDMRVQKDSAENVALCARIQLEVPPWKCNTLRVAYRGRRR